MEIIWCVGCEGIAVPIIYGLPGGELQNLAEQGAIVLGGCYVGDDDPAWHCRRCGSDFGRPSDPGEPMPAVAHTFAEYFDAWEIRLPERADVLRARGLIRARGWRIQWIFGTNDDGSEYLEFYAGHNMTNDRHHRIEASGALVALPAIAMVYVLKEGREEESRAEYRAHNQAVMEELVAKNLWPPDDINAFLRTQ